MWGGGGVPRSLVHIRLAHVTESGTRCEEEQVWEAAGYLPFSRARIGHFFQERPVLKNPFLEDALLRGYLRRHLPQDVRRKPILYIRYSVKIYDTEMTQDGATCPQLIMLIPILQSSQLILCSQALLAFLSYIL